MEDARSETWFVVPAFNEAEKVGEVVSCVQARGYSVVVIDDGSGDHTADVALTAGAHVLRHLVNRGQGAALQTGLEYALRSGAKAIVTFDSDGQHGLDDAEQMLDVLGTSDVDIVLGSRFKGRALHMSRVRRVVLSAAVIFTRLTTGLALSDTHNGLRVISRQAAAKINLRQDRMAHASELLSIIASEKMKYIEHPVTITYTEYSMRKGQRLSNAVRIIEDLFMEVLAR